MTRWDAGLSESSDMVTVRFKDTPCNPCPGAIGTSAERAAWQHLRGQAVRLIAPIPNSQIADPTCDSDTHWHIAMDDNIKAAALEHHVDDPLTKEYCVCRHVLEMGD